MGVMQKMTADEGRFSTLAQKFRDDESGATAIEYGLIVGLIFLAIVASVTAFANSTSDVYDEIDGAMESVIE